MKGKLEDLVMGYPYEDSICLFYTRETSPDWFNLTKESNNSYYKYIHSAFNPYNLQRALDYAVLFETLHVHPIDLPIYGENSPRDVIRVSDHSNKGSLLELIQKARTRDTRDQTLSRMLNRFKRDSNLVEQRLNWHILDSLKFGAPIALSENLVPVYNYKFNISKLKEQDVGKSSEKAREIDNTIEEELGASFKIKTWDDLLTLRKDSDIVNYRKKISEYLKIPNQDHLQEQIRLDVRDALSAVIEVEGFRKKERIQTYVSPALTLSDIFLQGMPIASIIGDVISIKRSLQMKSLEERYQWLLFRMRPLGYKRLKMS